MRSIFSIPFLILICVTFYSCASMSDILKSKDEGTAQVYPVPADKAWEISETVLHWENSGDIEEHHSPPYMLTTVGQNFVSAGNLVGIWLDPVDSENTMITVVIRKKSLVNFSLGITEEMFQRRFQQAVDIISSGKTLPIKPPKDNY